MAKMFLSYFRNKKPTVFVVTYLLWSGLTAVQSSLSITTWLLPSLTEGTFKSSYLLDQSVSLTLPHSHRWTILPSDSHCTAPIMDQMDHPISSSISLMDSLDPTDPLNGLVH